MEGYGWLSVRFWLSALISDNDDGGRSCDVRAVSCAIRAYRFSYSVRFGLIARRIRSIRSSGRSERVHPRYRFEIGERNFPRREHTDGVTKRRWPKGEKLAENLADFQRSRTTFNGSLGVKRRTTNSLVASKRCREFIAIHRTMPAPPFFPRRFYLNGHFP
jgi:hypothetical protein